MTLRWPETSKADADVVIDVANICYDDVLPGDGVASLARLEAVVDAWAEWVRPQRSRFCFISDRSMLQDLRMSERHLLEVAARQGKVRLEAIADPAILQVASASLAAVVSYDYFRDFRRRFAWIQGNTDRFYGWEATTPGVRIVPRDMGVEAGYALSRAEERKDRVGKGDAAWKCSNLACSRLQHERCSTCPHCGGELRSTAHTSDVIELVVSVGERVVDRIAIQPGDRVILGRHRWGQDSALAGALGAEGQIKLSRAHLAVENTSGSAVVTDLASTNGTRLLRWDADRGAYSRGPLLRPHVAERLSLAQAVILGDVVVVRQSGRKYPHPLALRHGHPTLQQDPSATIQHRRNPSPLG
jgi:hypothetical protein